MAAAAILYFWNSEILLAIGVERVETHQHAKFCQNRSNGCKDIKIFPFFKMAAAAILDCRIHKILLADSVLRGQTHHVPNFVNIGQLVAKILRFFDFSRWWPPPSWIFEIAKFYCLLGSRVLRRISMPNFVKIGQSVAKILRFLNFSRWRPSAILDMFEAYLDHPQWALGLSLLSFNCFFTISPVVTTRGHTAKISKPRNQLDLRHYFFLKPRNWQMEQFTTKRHQFQYAELLQKWFG